MSAVPSQRTLTGVATPNRASSTTPPPRRASPSPSEAACGTATAFTPSKNASATVDGLKSLAPASRVLKTSPWSAWPSAFMMETALRMRSAVLMAVPCAALSPSKIFARCLQITAPAMENSGAGITTSVTKSARSSPTAAASETRTTSGSARSAWPGASQQGLPKSSSLTHCLAQGPQPGQPAMASREKRWHRTDNYPGTGMNPCFREASATARNFLVVDMGFSQGGVALLLVGCKGPHSPRVCTLLRMHVSMLCKGRHVANEARQPIGACRNSGMNSHNNNNNLLFVPCPSGWVSPSTLGGFQQRLKSPQRRRRKTRREESSAFLAATSLECFLGASSHLPPLPCSSRSTHNWRTHRTMEW